MTPKVMIVDTGKEFEENILREHAANLHYKKSSNKDGKDYESSCQFLVPALKSKKKLYISPDGVYNKINLETLTVSDVKGNTKFLGDIYDIHIVNSARDLIFRDTTVFTSKTITFFGYPDYNLNKNDQSILAKAAGLDTVAISFLRGGDPATGEYVFKPLPATKHEVEEIAQSLVQKGWETEVYTGVEALEERIKQIQSPRILHIATHGFFAADIPDSKERFMGLDTRGMSENPLLRSGLAFAGAERTRTDTTHELLQGMDDGILTAEEAQYLHLDSTELVVLSACETGLGEIVNGEGVYGLQRAFRAAGARSVLMSLWKVDDNATEVLMENFYKHWLEDGMTKHDALWKAKLDLRNDRNHPEWAAPYYWGAFVLIGE